MRTVHDAPITIDVKYLKQNNFDNIDDAIDALIFLKSLNNNVKNDFITRARMKHAYKSNPNIISDMLMENNVGTIYDFIINKGHTDILVLYGPAKTVAFSYDNILYTGFDDPLVQMQLVQHPEGKFAKVPITELA